MPNWLTNVTLASAMLAAAGPAMAQGRAVTVTLEGVRSDAGQVLVGLCDDPKAPFPGACRAAQGSVKAQAGRTVVTLTGIKPGAYALQAFHDENGDGRPQVPPEGYAYGNDAAWPPSFKAASIEIAGDAQVRVSMTYLAAVAGQAQGSTGAPPPAGVSRIDLRDRGLYGAFYVPAGARSRPAILVVGGSEGGIAISALATSFAKAGYPTLALAYWNEQGLPKTLEEVPLEYFDRAVAWLGARPEVDPAAMGAVGWSRGSEAVLLLASRNKAVRAVAAAAPSAVVWQGIDPANMAGTGRSAWSVGGKPLPFLVPDASAYRPGGSIAPLFIRSLPQADRKPETVIPVERINGPVLLISGADDQLWPSVQFADRLAARLRSAGFKHRVENLQYPSAGHAVFVGEPGGLMAQAYAAPNPVFGGAPAADAKAWADNWPKTLAFFNKALGRGRR